jgi:hypothetical protein
MAVECRNPAKCGCCWKEGHISRHCRYTKLNPAAPPFHPTDRPSSPTKEESRFDELLKGSYPTSPPPMSEGRPANLTCYADRTPEFTAESL